MFDLSSELREAAKSAGIDLFGVTSAEPLPVHPEIASHLQPRDILPEARAVVLTGFCISYEPRVTLPEPHRPRGRFTPFGSRVFSQMWNHCAAFATDAPLAAVEAPLYDTACPKGCRLCLDACPTSAISRPFKVDLSRCITDWLWGGFAPAGLRAKQQDRLFGCAECVLACPQSAKIAPRRRYPVLLDPIGDSPELIPMLSMDEEYYRGVVPAFPQQAGLEAMRGNAVIALGNLRDPAAAEALAKTLGDERPQIRAYSAWALGRIGGARARGFLASALAAEENPAVIGEITEALESAW